MVDLLQNQLMVVLLLKVSLPNLSKNYYDFTTVPLVCYFKDFVDFIASKILRLDSSRFTVFTLQLQLLILTP